MSLQGEIYALNELLQMGRGSIEITLTEDGNVGVYWAGRKGCCITGDSVMDALRGRYFENELNMERRIEAKNGK